MGSKTLSITIPEDMYALIDEQRKSGHYSRSEFVREALRRFLTIPTAQATPEEITAIEEGRKAHEKGDFVTLAGLDAQLARDNV